jgi:GNAT superfamily N-acetyltransferase
MREMAEVVQIRPAALGDAQGIALIWQELGWLDSLKNKTLPEMEAQISRQLKLCLNRDGHTVLVAENHTGQVAGYVVVHWSPCMFLKGPEGFVSELFVADHARGKGIGGLLLKEVKRLARQKGCPRLGLINARHRESYKRGFYAKQGWQERPEMANFVLYLEDA